MTYNIDFSIAALIFLVIFYIFIKVQYGTQIWSNAIFRRVLVAIFIADVCDIASSLVMSHLGQVPLTWCNVAMMMYNLFAVGSVYQVLEYIRNLTQGTQKRKIYDWINTFLMAVYFASCVTNPFTHAYFRFEEPDIYTHGPLFLMIYVMAAYFFGVSIGKVLLNRKKFVRKQFVALMAFLTISAFGMLLQEVVVPHLLIMFFTATIASFIMLFAFETPDYQLLVKTTEELKQSQSLLETAREKEKEQTRILRELTKTASWSLEFAEDGQVKETYWSPEFYHMLGREATNEKNVWMDSIHPDDRDNALEQFMEGMTGRGIYDTEFRLADVKGNYRWYRGSGALKYENGRAVAYQGAIQDIHEEVLKGQLMQEKIKAVSDLEKSQKALEVALSDAQQANRAKSQFLSNMSHDIRTPMNAIVGFSELAIENIDDKKQIADYLGKIQVSSNHLLSLINDILDMNRIESGKTKIEEAPESILDIFAGIKTITLADAAKRDLEYSEDYSGVKNPNVMCDKMRLNRILLNCIGNSIKFTPPGGKLSVSVTEAPGEDEKVNKYTIRISDTGIGMSPEFLKRVFEPFEREHTSTISKTQGTGLGMAITKSLVELMGGTIVIESTVNVGTTYIITLPFTKCNDAEAVIKAKAGLSEEELQRMSEFLKGRHLLLVDDNAINRTLARKVLAKKGITLDEAENGQEAVDKIRNSKPGEYELILMDVQMPIMNGYEATDVIRALEDKELAVIPIIAMTADAFEEDKKRCIEHGMNGHIAKPFKANELVQTLYQVLKR